MPMCGCIGDGSASVSYASRVVAVDPDDDTIRRYVVRHYRFDPDRHERRHVVVAAFDNESEWDWCLGATEAALRARRDTGEAVDPREHVSGTVYEPGHRRLQQNGRLLRRAAEHGVVPPNWQDLEVPPNIGVVQAGRPDRRMPWWRNRAAPSGRSRRLRYRYAAVGVVAALVTGAVIWWSWTATVAISHHDLEAAVTGSSAPGAAHPLRVDRWGSTLCKRPIPMGPDMCPNSDLLYDSGPVPTERFRQQWQDALERDGWIRHTETRAERASNWPSVWWTRGRVAISMFTLANNQRGPYFVWGTGDLVVTTQGVGDEYGELPGPSYGQPPDVGTDP